MQKNNRTIPEVQELNRTWNVAIAEKIDESSKRQN